MTNIYPFRAWHYNLKKIQNPAQVVAPPYDVIDDPLLEKLHRLSPHNVVWIDLPQEENGKDKYRVAGEKFQEWKKAGILTQDSQPSIYLYFQTYQLPDGRKITRKGFFARRRLEGFENGGVKPHEKTFAGPKADRLNLTQATLANISPIFGLFPDLENRVGPQLDGLSQADPLMKFVTENGEEHSLWVVDDPKRIEALLEPIQSKHVMIADGHHRYETALNYRELRKTELGDAYTGEEDFNFVLMYFCSLEDPGLVVLPTHRVLSERPGIEPDMARKLMERYAGIKKFSAEQSAEALQYMVAGGEREHMLGWIHDGQIEVLTFDSEKILESQSLNHLHFALRDLDVTILHDLLMEEILGVPKGAQREYGTLRYIKAAEEAVQLTQEKNTYGFLMNATKISQMEAVTEIGETMPQKSTFFYPKIPTGLIFNDLE